MNRKHFAWKPWSRLALCASFFLVAVAIDARPTTGWRTDGTGIYADAIPPTQWSANQNILWSTDLGSWGNGSPVVAGDRVFVGAEPTTLVCVSLETGEELWRRDNSRIELLDEADAAEVSAAMEAGASQMEELHQAESRLGRLRRILSRNRNNAEALAEQKELQARVETLTQQLAGIRDYQLPSSHNDNGYSSPTPITDGKHIYAVYGNGVAAAYDLDGQRLWIREVQEPDHRWGMSASPELIDGVVVLQLQELVGLDAATGDELWRTPSERSFGSPMAISVDGVSAVVSAGGVIVAPKTGEVLADLGDTLSYCAPVWKDGVLYFIEADATAYKLTADQGRIQSQRLWRTDIKGDRHYASPVVHKGLIYTVSRGEEMTVLDMQTGKIIYEQDVQLNGPKPNSAYTSVTLAGDQLYLGSVGGTSLVLATGTDYQELARNTLDGHRSTPVFVGDRMLLRGLEKLWCVSE